MSTAHYREIQAPKVFRGVSLLPTEYEANPSARMTSQVFEAWLQKWNNKLARSGRKIALFIDNCTARPPYPKFGVYSGNFSTSKRSSLVTRGL